MHICVCIDLHSYLYICMANLFTDKYPTVYIRMCVCNGVIALCCSVLQCVAVCCSVLQCVAYMNININTYIQLCVSVCNHFLDAQDKL